jgi:hypothetical protein
MAKRTVLLVVLWSALFARQAYAEIFFSNSIHTQYLSNTWLDRSVEWDLMLQPALSLELDFLDIWAIGYSARLEAYVQHTELFFHEHELFAAVNPTFGDDDEHELILMGYVRTGKNTDTFEAVNAVYPGGMLTLGLEPAPWLYLETFVSTEYRWFYNNVENSSLDTWGRITTTLSLPSRTSISPRFALGYRYYPAPVSGMEEPWDLQVKPGIRVAQGVGETSGIWLDYEYLHTVNDNNLAVGEMQAAEMNFVGTDFMFSGHGVTVGGKRIWNAHVETSLDIFWQKRWYNGLEVFDEVGDSTGIARDDDRVGGAASFRFEKELSNDTQSLFSVGATYSYLRQFSNDSWFDTDLHAVSLESTIDW